jgi:Ca2+-transporting ATPase
MEKEHLFSRPLEKLYDTFNTSETGLDDEQVRKHREEYGTNELESHEKKSIWALLWSQVNNPVIYLLLAACTISLIFKDYPEAIAIFIVIILNTIIGFWMEYRAQTSMEALDKMDPLHARAKRNGEVQDLKAATLVPGDVILLESGDIVPADARIITSKELNADESMLTGESVPVDKEPGELPEETQVADRTNMLFKGTAITTGKAEALVVATGMESELGQISGMVREATTDEIPLNRKLGQLSKRLIWVILGLSVAFFVAGWIAGKEIYILLQTAIAWTVAAIPEGLAIVASLSLARGMLRLSRQNVIIRKLAAIETLGSTTMILTDKTGTLTRNKLTATVLDTSSGPTNLSDTSGESGKKTTGQSAEATGNHSDKISKIFQQAFRVFSLCNDLGEEDGTFRGDPLEVALAEFSQAHDTERFNAFRKLEKVNEDPFDSDSMLMGTIHDTGDNLFIAVKGATSAVLDKCTHYMKNGDTVQLDDQVKEKWTKADQDYSAEGLKVIGLAFREEPKKKKKELAEQEEFMENLTFIGVTGFIDPVREDVREPIATCRRSGIRVVMVTGDHPETALNIAKEVQLVDPEQEESGTVMHGKDLDNTKDISGIAVFARVDPAQKLDIITYFKDQGEIVAMTGDGVNDAPALKKADIGIAMGKRGTQVARDVSDMVLLDDAFSSIVTAIEQGRIIFDNIRKFIIYQLSYHLAEIIIIAGISFTMFKLPLLPLQILLLNILSDVFPALALGVGKGSSNVMDRPPRDPDTPIITPKDWLTTGIYGVVISVYVIGAYVLASKGLDMSDTVSNNIAYFSLAIAQLLHVFDMRDAKEHLFKNQVTRNKYIWMALAFCGAMLMVTYFVPVLSNALSFTDLSPTAWGIIAATGALPMLTIQVIKELRKS